MPSLPRTVRDLTNPERLYDVFWNLHHEQFQADLDGWRIRIEISYVSTQPLLPNGKPTGACKEHGNVTTALLYLGFEPV